MSYVTGGQTELLYAFSGQSTALATFTTEDNLLKTYPPIIIPPGFWKGTGSLSKSLKVKAWGRMGSTTTGPTFIWTARLLTSTTWSAAGIVLGASATLTMNASITLAPWEYELDVVLQTEAIGGASTVKSMGKVYSPKGLASPFGGTIPDSNVAPTVATVDNSTQYYLFLSATCGTSNAANLIQTEMIKVYGEN